MMRWQAEIRHDLLQVAEVGGRHHAGQQVNGAVPALLGQAVSRADGGVEPLHVGAGVAGRGDPDDMAGSRPASFYLADEIPAR